MKTVLLSKNELEKAALMLKEGKIVAFPTETVFGMGIVFDNLSALERLKLIKGRDAAKPFTLVVSEVSEIAEYSILTNKTKAIINAFMPGPITLILPAKAALIGPITNNSTFIGIRVSSEPNVARLIKLVGKPLLLPSANKSGTPALFVSDDVYDVFNGEIAAVIEGEATGSKASTVIKISDKIELMREGEIPFEIIKEKFEGESK